MVIPLAAISIAFFQSHCELGKFALLFHRLGTANFFAQNVKAGGATMSMSLNITFPGFHT